MLQKKVLGLSAASLGRFVLRARKAAGLRGSVDVLITGSAAMRAMNARFRKKDKATDVLSFPSELQGQKRNGARAFAGEIAISADIATQNAMRLGHSAAIEVKILVLHGILHLAGFDHERDNGQMARKEAKLRKVLRLPTALIERSHSDDEDFVTLRRSTNSRSAQRTA
jgi:probable rRNA maturation factor